MAVLTISDDGRGHDGAEGMGTRAMRQRVEALGGRIERDDSGGTRLLVRVPVAPAVRGSGEIPRGSGEACAADPNALAGAQRSGAAE